MIQPVRGDLLGEHRAYGAPFPLSGAVFLPPVRPGVVVVVTASGRLQLKPPSSVIASGDTIRLPRDAADVWAYSCEAAVIHRTLSAPTDGPQAHILGRTALCDVVSSGHTELLDGAGFDTFCPLGPWIVEGASAALTAAVARASAVLTLLPGDVVALRTGARQRLSTGEYSRVEIPGLGVLKNPVEGQV